tara:strand:+ start:487 stop:675 length:189 start_codon:yes stop_codon:yes gene_type:complete
MSTILYDNYLLKPKELELALKKQEQWRKKQIKIFFEEGRPIYGRYINGILVKPDIRNTKKLY